MKRQSTLQHPLADCLIIAAGRGSRLSEKKLVKPLLRVAGLPLIERVILTAEEAGLKNFYVVTGYQRDRIEYYLSELSLRRKLNITCIYNQKWESEGNGVSVLTASPYLKNTFVLLMADHLFEPSTLSDLIKQPIGEGEIILATDSRIKGNTNVDMEDVTRVKVENGFIVNIGKELPEYNAFDTGMFLCTHSIFSGIEESTAKGNSSLSGGVQVLADRGKAKVFDIDSRYWKDIDTVKDLKRAERHIFFRSGKPLDGWVSRKINRKVSTRIFSPLLLNLFPDITPNIASIISFLTAILAGTAFFLLRPLPGAIILQIASILDGCDGEIARLKKTGTSFGGFLDSIFDRYADTFLLFGMLYFSLTSLKSLSAPLIWAFSILAVVGNLMVSYTSAKSVTDFGYRYKGRWITAGRGRDFRLFILFISGVMALIHPVFVLAGISFVALLTNMIVLKRIIISRYISSKDNPSLFFNTKAIIFDFDGTLADTMSFLTEKATELISKNYGIAEEEARRRYLETSGLDFPSQLEILFPSDPKNRKIAEIFEAEKQSRIMELPLFQDTVKTLRAFREENLKLFLCSSTDSELLKRYCKEKGIYDFFEECLGLKPGFRKQKQLLYIIEKYGFKPNEVLFVGDSLKDGEISGKAGIPFLGISRIFEKRDFSRKGLSCIEDLTSLYRVYRKAVKLWNQVG